MSIKVSPELLARLEQDNRLNGTPVPVLIKGFKFRVKRGDDPSNPRPLQTEITREHIGEMLAEGLSWDTISRLCFGYAAVSPLKTFYFGRLIHPPSQEKQRKERRKERGSNPAHAGTAPSH